MPVVNLLGYQIEQLVADVMRLDQSGGSDSAALLRIRNTVSRELLESDLMEVTTAALGLLNTDTAANRLLSILAYCSEHFEIGTQVFSVVALPISIRMRALNRQHTSLRRGERGALKELAEKMRSATGANKVIFDTRLYRGTDLFQLRSRDMRRFLMQLAAGTLYPKGGPAELEISSTADGAFQQVYFLGVEVMDVPKYPQLDDWPIQMQSQAWLDFPSAALECADDVLFNANVQVEAQSHGIFYLARALDAGAKGDRDLRITEMLKALGSDGRGLQMYLTESPLRNQVRTLMVGALLTLEYKWDLLKDETIADFQRVLERLVHALFQDFETTHIHRLNSQEYGIQAVKQHVPLFRIVGSAT